MKKLSKTEKMWNKGERLYDDFVKKIGGDIKVSTPRTQALTLFATLSERKMKPRLIAEMCREFANNFDDDFFMEDNNLFRKIAIKELVR